MKTSGAASCRLWLTKGCNYFSLTQKSRLTLINNQSHLLCTFFAVCLVRASCSTVPNTQREIQAERRFHGDILTLTCNQVCRYDEWFHRAHCDDRGLTNVPNSTGCENAFMLELQNNYLTSITEGQMLGFKYIKTIDVSKNLLAHLHPGTFLNNSHLRNVILSHNKLEVLNGGVFNLAKLKRLYLNDNKIKTLHCEAFQDLRETSNLDVNESRTANLPVNTFINNLELIDLHGNLLQELPKGLFNGLESLREINLSSNHLINIPSPSILGLYLPLKVLDLSNNHLNQSSMVAPFLFTTEQDVYLHGNPFFCDCSFTEIQRWYTNLSQMKGVEATILSSYNVGCFHYGSFYDVNDDLPVNCDESNDVLESTLADYLSLSTTVSPNGRDVITTQLADEASTLHKERQSPHVIIKPLDGNGKFYAVEGCNIFHLLVYIAVTVTLLLLFVIIIIIYAFYVFRRKLSDFYTNIDIILEKSLICSNTVKSESV